MRVRLRLFGVLWLSGFEDFEGFEGPLKGYEGLVVVMLATWLSIRY